VETVVGERDDAVARDGMRGAVGDARESAREDVVVLGGGILGIVDKSVDGTGLLEEESGRMVRPEEVAVDIEFNAFDPVAASGRLGDVIAEDSSIEGTEDLERVSAFGIGAFAAFLGNHVVPREARPVEDRGGRSRVELDIGDGGLNRVGITHAEIERVYRLVVVGEANLVVEMRATRAACVAGMCEKLAFGDGDRVGRKVNVEGESLVGILIVADERGERLAVVVEVHIYRAEAVGMGDVDVLATTPWRDTYAADVAVGVGIDILAHLAAHTEVDAAVVVVGTYLGERRREGDRDMEGVVEIVLRDAVGNHGVERQRSGSRRLGRDGVGRSLRAALRLLASRQRDMGKEE
jgi:hypothetical protein